MSHTSVMKSKIQSHYPSLSKSEKKIADYILENFSEIMYLSVTELGEKAGVGETSVFRFCKHIGLKGYHEFKLLIAQDTVMIENEIKVNSSDDLKHFAEVIKDNIVEKLNECLTFLDNKQLDLAISYIKNSKRICFMGLGSSGISAQTAKERFLRLGVIAETALDAHRQNTVASIFDHDDIIIAFSISGDTKDLIEALEMARENKVKIIVVTSYMKSPITNLADIVLITSGKEHFMEGGTLASSISQLYIVDILVTGYYLSDIEKSQEMREKTGRAIMGKIYTNQ